MIWEKEKTWKNTSVKESSFIYPASGFKSNPFRGLQYIKSEIVPYLGGGEVVANSECIYQKHHSLKEFSGSNVLVVGAGPSASDNRVDYASKEYDHIISCNHFFKMKKLNEVAMSMVFLGDEVNLQDTDLLGYASKSIKTLFCFENIGRSKRELLDFKQRYQDRVLWAHTRYHSKIGAITRIVSFLSALSPARISIVGMDGFIPSQLQEQYKHSFQENKKQTGTYESAHDEAGIIFKYKQQYLEFWDYILHDIGANIEYVNLGHGHPCNLSTFILQEKIGADYQDYLSDPARRAGRGEK